MKNQRSPKFIEVEDNVSYSPPMGMWFSEPELKPDEVVSFQAAANFAKGRRAIGGQITVTDQRCLFVPNRLDGLTGASRIDVARGAISNVRTIAPGKQAARQYGIGATVRTQVAVDYSGGTLVVQVSDVDALAAALTNTVA